MSPSSRGGTAPSGRWLELFLLLAATAVTLCGLYLVNGARLAAVARADAALGSAPLDINTVNSSTELLPLLTFLPDPEDRNFAARHIFERIGSGSLGSVGELRRIRVTGDQTRRTRGLSSFPARLQEARKEAQPGESVSVPLLTAAQIRVLRPQIVVRSAAQFHNQLLIYSAVFLLPFFVVHGLWAFRGFGGDRILLPVAHLLSGIGFIMMVRLREPFREELLFPDFATGVALGCVALYLCSLPDYERTALRRLAYLPLLLSFVASAVLLFFGSGPGISDAKVNLRLGPLSVQPVELIKVLLVLFLAGYFANRWEFFREMRERSTALPGWLRGFDIPRFKYALPVAVAAGAAILFFFLQKDLGPALVFLVLFLSMYAVARARAFGAVLGLSLLVGAFAVGYELNSPRTVASRVSIWLSPFDNYVRPGGDHLAQSLWTFSSGGFWGAGLGLGEPESVPAVHTDLILAAAGEELGFVGLLAIYALYAVFLHRGLRLSTAAPGHYTFFLGLGFTLLIGLQVALISGGVLGLVPLSGVVTPFVNYGKSSAVMNFAIVGVLAAVSARTGPAERNEPFRRQVRWAATLLGVIAAAIILKAVWVQVLGPERTMVTGALIVQGDGYRRYTYNPRLVEASEIIPRGAIYDRNGIPLAASSVPELERHKEEYQRLGIDPAGFSVPGLRRRYPFGALTFHILGDMPTRLNWAAPNTSYIERDYNVTLQGYDDRAAIVNVDDKPGGPKHPVLRRDLRELIPVAQYRYQPGNRQVQQLLERDRDVHLTLDMRLQKAVADIVDRHVRDEGMEKGAAVVIDPATGDLLASVSYPWRGAAEAVHLIETSTEEIDLSGFRDSLLDRPRYGLYPPGSSFKLVTAGAALQVRDNIENETFECRKLPDGRIGNFVKGWGKPIRDDVMDKVPHGTVNMSKGIIHSCNAYFAQLGTYVVGAERLLRMADEFGIRAASPATVKQLHESLPQASYGQGQVVATPLQMARVAATIGNGGVMQSARWVPVEQAPAGKKVLPPEHARLLGQFMRGVVTEGTGRAAAGAGVPVAGKTGTAELQGKPSHAWFVGFAPYGAVEGRKIAFAVIVEHGRYGGRVAAPLAAEIVSAAQRLGVFEREER
jgi:cell division protein FtsW (lipid II flippase)